ncbi:MAG TPA: STAS domain-containing protein [Bacteroidota bacterium]|nr:STAS domain-containing protein [Bacteroidota bacterium]
MASDILVKSELRGSLGIISLSGDISGGTEEALRKAYETLGKGGATKILFRFAQGCYINSAGIAIIILIVSESKKSRQKVGATGLSAHFQKIFEMIGLTDYIQVFQTEEEALKKL